MRRSIFVGAAAAALAGPAAAHVAPCVFHPNKSDLRHLAVLASDQVENKGLKYIGAVGTCKAEDPARSQRDGSSGFRHVRCRMKTHNGYRFLVTFHTRKCDDFFVTVIRTL